MRVSLNQIALTFVAGALALTAVSSAVSAADGSIGSEYGSREPAICQDRTQPAEGPPSEEQLLYHLRCTMEGIGDGRLYLAEDLTAEVSGEGRAFDSQRDYYDNIDESALIYPISGSLLRYNCHVLDGTNDGTSCETFLEEEATGACYKETSGDWVCRMSDLSQVRNDGAPPPQ